MLCPGCTGTAEKDPPVPTMELRRMGVPLRYLGARFEAWMPSSGGPRRAVEEYVAAWPPAKPLLFLAGPVGTVVGALTVGKATPYLVHAFPGTGANAVVMAGSMSAVLAALLVWVGYRDGPHPFPPRPFSWNLVRTVAGQRHWQLATGGYLGHMFELYSYWTWIPAFLAASAVVSPLPSGVVLLLSFLTIAIGGAGCLWGGFVADRIGRERLVIIAMAASGACAMLVGLTFGRSWWLLAPVALAWGFFVVADSAQFSVLVTESVPAHAVGTALMLQTSLGFLLTTVTIQVVPPVVSAVGWPWAFPLLAIGPFAGIAAIRQLVALKARQGTDTIHPA